MLTFCFRTLVVRADTRASRMSRPSADQFERQYKVGPVLGKGGFGVVYAGVRCRDGHKVAIKHVAKLKIKEWGKVRLFFSFFQIFQSYLRVLSSQKKGAVETIL